MACLRRLFFALAAFSILFCLFLYGFHLSRGELVVLQTSSQGPSRVLLSRALHQALVATGRQNHLWIIFTKVVDKHSPIKYKLKVMLTSLLEYTSILVTLNIITDDKSRPIAQEVIDRAVNTTGKQINVLYYNIGEVTRKLSDIVSVMKGYFTSHRGAYYSDALFFVSLGLHRIAPTTQDRVVMMDVDTRWHEDIANLYKVFNNFSDSQLFGAALEQSPVYHHVLYAWRGRHKTTLLGKPQSEGGFPGLNSGLLLFKLDSIRKSEVYKGLLTPEMLSNLTLKYNFKGHLGDQDFYTLTAFERPELFHVLDCSWNRQLCTWWKQHGYQDTFHKFNACPSPARIQHGNCNTRIPAS